MNKQKAQCITCKLPEVEALNEAALEFRDKGLEIPIALFHKWLTTQRGHSPEDLKKRTLGNHFYNRHFIKALDQ